MHTMTNIRKVGNAVLGLVCLTSDQVYKDDRISFRTMTRKRLLTLSFSERLRVLDELYRENITMLDNAIRFCLQNKIGMYRMSSSMFPFADWKEDQAFKHLLELYADELADIGASAKEHCIRIVIHPDQFCVLSSDSVDVVINSIRTLEHHAWMMDVMGLPQSTWAAMNLHGGKRDRPAQLKKTILGLPVGIRSRLTLENCEYSYDVNALYDVCSSTNVPILFDFHHEAVHHSYKSYDVDGIHTAYGRALETWSDPTKSLTHLSNGIDGIHDRRHSLLISDFPELAKTSPYCEIEAKGKELAIFGLTN